MALFLRDIHLSNVKVTEDVLTQLYEVFVNRAQPLIESADQQGREDKKPIVFSVIRFDEKGYRVFSLGDLLLHFRRAKSVERVIITIETGESLQSGRGLGEHLEVRFDRMDDKLCYLSVTADDSDWVEASYSSVLEVVNKNKTKNGWARSGWSTLIIQLLGLITGFALSLWAALKISPSLAIENAFIITFFFALLVFSNAWGYVNSIVLSWVHRLFPNVYFYRSDIDRIDWLLQAIIGGIATALMLYLLSGVFTFIGSILSSLPK
ncbi:hypothetical protein [Microbulbifer hainanensis]|uniref:hypothetical protein n=1 Tax=Microbulbifer hainanensis TaxID=2735675 RepID=UPI0018677CD6|nr:hypothetical protein [Microbulbifer hainanensis]